jgi:hypothetical protein
MVSGHRGQTRLLSNSSDGLQALHEVTITSAVFALQDVSARDFETSMLFDHGLDNSAG